MGSYAQLEISGYPVFPQKSYVYPIIMTLLKESDKKVYERSVSERNPLVWGKSEEGEGKKRELAYEYSIKAKYAAHRLDIMRFTLARAREEFHGAVDSIIDDLQNGGICLDLWWMEEDKKISFIAEYTFDKWAHTFREVIEKGITSWSDKGKELMESSPLIKLVLNNEEEFQYGFPMSDIRYFLRAALDLVDPESNIVLDITELVHAGYYEGTEELSRIASYAFSSEYLTSSTIIVLTEGATDTHALKKTLVLLYPHLSR